MVVKQIHMLLYVFSTYTLVKEMVWQCKEKSEKNIPALYLENIVEILGDTMTKLNTYVYVFYAAL